MFKSLSDDEKENYRRLICQKKRHWQQKDRKRCLKNDRVVDYLTTSFRSTISTYWFKKLTKPEIKKQYNRHVETLTGKKNANAGQDINDDATMLDQVLADISEAQEMLESACGSFGLAGGHASLAGKTSQLKNAIKEQLPMIKALFKDVNRINDEYNGLLRIQQDLAVELNKLSEHDDRRPDVEQQLELAKRDAKDAYARLKEAKTNAEKQQKQVQQRLTTLATELQEELTTLHTDLEKGTKPFDFDGMKLTKCGDANFDSILEQVKAKCFDDFKQMACSHASNYSEKLHQLGREIYNESRLMYEICFSRFQHVMDQTGDMANRATNLVNSISNFFPSLLSSLLAPGEPETTDDKGDQGRGDIIQNVSTLN